MRVCLQQGQGNRLDCGDVNEAFESGECEHVIEGVAKCGGQEHFYLEPQCCVIIPGEYDEMNVISSSQVRVLVCVDGALSWSFLLA